MKDSTTIREALPEFYKTYGLPEDGGQEESAARIELNKHIHFYIPNFDARRKALLKHDIHHLATGYSGVMMGETEISTWEISTGCIRYWAAFLINLSGMMIGVGINLKGIWKAFLRGRVTTNLYYDRFSDTELLDMTIGEVREALRLNQPVAKKPSLADFLSFIFWLGVGGIVSVLSLVLLPAVIIYSVVVFIGNSQTSSATKLP